MGGTWGTLAAGLFATLAVNTAGANGLFYGKWNALFETIAGGGGNLGFCLWYDLDNRQTGGYHHGTESQ